MLWEFVRTFTGVMLPSFKATRWAVFDPIYKGLNEMETQDI